MADDDTTRGAEPDRAATTWSRRMVAGGLVGAAGAGLTAARASATGEQPFQGAERPRPARRPNLLVILADDLGWGDLSCYGAERIRTPNLDRLASTGLRFTQGYAASSWCSSTRFALYTGRHPGRLEGGLREPIQRPNELDGIPADQPTLASLVNRAGYDTMMIGKWHCGFLPTFSPTRSGWDDFVGNFGGVVDYFSKVNELAQYDLYEGEVEYQDLRYYTDIITERAVDFIGGRGKDDAPWLVNLNYTTPHCPWEGPNDQAVSDELTGRILSGEGGLGAGGVLQHFDGGSIDKYRELVENLDQAVGAVLRELDRTGQRENTAVLFSSDNGGDRFADMWPFSGAKGHLQEGGIRVPTILSWPAALPRRQVVETPVTTVDWTATLLEFAGAAADPGHPLDGASLAGYLLRGEPAPSKDLFWRLVDQRALRRGDLKYLRLGGRDYLFDLAADVREWANLAGRRPDDLAALRQAWEQVDAGLLPYPEDQRSNTFYIGC
ncbi:MAG: sulfatase family protein [Dermatophilaceae bacterium]